ncbi:hypothetical protein P175DRAFT_0492274 [Aspergillus ochraceoroseus IBT 24754]|uniref:F-box domain-containing protein n=1 Tax=Aspergillus ochraceoroseus IBT 24754 TaxID=1392256 RepID=A0A2T5LZD3_9EURO|nr:uncharacterized protein P175DRAFT_0492274 [Aspergillus ochraceoroseus IBT 24754]PTU21633.1 hypothetical protein P175DRAFT_0492274 [Aspergillus ochraceoroseus IBT 24754]
MHRGFDDLPYELFLEIVSYIEDCSSLYSLLRASPALSRVFNHNGLEITRSVFSKDNMCDQILESIHIIAVLQSSSPWPFPTLHEFISRFIRVTVRDPEAPYTPLLPPAPVLSTDLPDTTPTQTIRRILSVYAQISYLTSACIQLCLQRFQAIQPENIVNPEARYHATSGPRKDKIAPWKQTFESVQVPFHDFGPPTWDEEQRVSRALWRIQLFYDLRTAAAQSRLGWSSQDLKHLQSMHERDLYVGGRSRYEPMEIDTVIDYLNHVRGAGSPRGDSSKASPPLRLPFLSHPVKRKWPIPKRPPPGSSHFKFSVDIPAFGLKEYKVLAGLHFSPLRTVRFDFYRRLGIAFWCQKRIQEAGLCPTYPGARSINVSSWLFAWRSILDPGDIETVEQRLEWELEEYKTKGGAIRGLDRSYWGWT